MSCDCKKGSFSGAGAGAYSRATTQSSTFAWDSAGIKRSRTVTVNAEKESSRQLTHQIPNEKRRTNPTARRSHPRHP